MFCVDADAEVVGLAGWVFVAVGASVAAAVDAVIGVERSAVVAGCYHAVFYRHYGADAVAGAAGAGTNGDCDAH